MNLFHFWRWLRDIFRRDRRERVSEAWMKERGRRDDE